MSVHKKYEAGRTMAPGLAVRGNLVKLYKERDNRLVALHSSACAALAP